MVHAARQTTECGYRWLATACLLSTRPRARHPDAKVTLRREGCHKSAPGSALDRVVRASGSLCDEEYKDPEGRPRWLVHSCTSFATANRVRPPTTSRTKVCRGSAATRPTGWADGSAQCRSRPSTTAH